MKIETIAKNPKLKLPKRETKKQFLQRLFDPKQWEYNGKRVDCSHNKVKCICGRSIKTGYIIENGDKQIILGSHCLLSFFS